MELKYKVDSLMWKKNHTFNYELHCCPMGRHSLDSLCATLFDSEAEARKVIRRYIHNYYNNSHYYKDSPGYYGEIDESCFVIRPAEDWEAEGWESEDMRDAAHAYWG